jgi:hypothetical protein
MHILLLMLWCIECDAHTGEQMMHILATMHSEKCTCSWDMMPVMLVSMTCLLMQLAGNKRDNIE